MNRNLACLIVPVLVLAACGSDTKTTTFRGADGKTATVEHRADGNGPITINTTDSDGKALTATLGGEGNPWPVKAPPYLPEYPGAKIMSVVDTGGEGKGAGGGMVSFESADTPAKIVAFYKEKAASAGLKEEMSMMMPTGQLVSAKAPNGDQSMVNATTENGKTQAVITYSSGAND